MRSDSKRVLVTNDDGVDAPGIRALAKAALRAGCTVTVVAPDGDRSGSAAAIGPLSTTPPRRLHVEGIPELSVFAVDAPPAVVVLASHAGAFGPPPLLDARCAPGQATQVVELRPSHLSCPHHIDVIDARRIDQERSLNADAM